MKIAVALMALVAGCISPEQAARNQQLQAEAYREGLANQCSNMGFTRYTDAHSNCILSLHQQRINLIGGALIQQYQQQQQRPVQTNCTRDYFGNMKCTTQ